MLCGNFKPVGQAQAWAGRSWLLPLYGTAVSNGAGSRCGEIIQHRLQLNLRANRLESFDALMQLLILKHVISPWRGPSCISYISALLTSRCDGHHGKARSRSEHEGIIDKVLGRQLLRAHHHLDWINLNRRGGDTSLRG